MPSRTDTAGHTKAQYTTVLDHTKKVSQLHQEISDPRLLAAFQDLVIQELEAKLTR